jgi:hypothetical protein
LETSLYSGDTTSHSGLSTFISQMLKVERTPSNVWISFRWFWFWTPYANIN